MSDTINQENDTDHTEGSGRDDGGKKKKVAIVIAILSAIIVIQGIKMYLDSRELTVSEENLSESKEELASTVERLHEIRTELDKSIAETKKLGGDVADLEEAKAELEAELKNVRGRTSKNIERLKNKVEGYEQLLRLKDKELEKLRSINKELYTENKTLQVKQNKLSDSIVQLAQSTDELASKVAIASRLKVENMTVAALNARGRELRAPFRGKKVGKLRVTFTIADNKVAPIEGKKILIRVVGQDDQVIFDVAKGSGTFMYNGKEEFYTSAQEILFDNTRQKMTFFYEKGSKYAPGSYRVDVFTDDYHMGSATFEVK